MRNLGLLGWRTNQWIKYYFRAKTVYDVDSPVIFRLFNDVIDDERYYYFYDEISDLRKVISKSKASISRIDFGAGSSTGLKKTETLSKLLLASCDFQKGKILHGLALFFDSRNILELGTQLGFSAMYLSGKIKSTNVTTIEGDPILYKIALEHFDKLGFQQINAINDRFDNLLPNLLKQNKYDLVFIDGNHSYEATMRYVNWMLQSHASNIVIVLDDIYWSSNMMKAWNEIQNLPELQMCLDLFHLGIVARNPEILQPIRRSLISSRKKRLNWGFWR